MLTIRLFFQAEDGIRDLVRSRGLGDVYKRQAPDVDDDRPDRRVRPARAGMSPALSACRMTGHCAVSYTHLTLPTSDLV